MTSFVHVDYPTEHPGVVRAERVAEGFKAIVRGFDGARASASMLLAAVVAALLVVANQVIDTWSDGHLLAAWIVMWTVAFAALALLAKPLKRVSTGVRLTFKRWVAVRREATEDRKLWNVALADARVMADISRAMSARAAREVKSYY